MFYLNINVEVKIVSPEIVAALLAFAEALPQMNLGVAKIVEEIPKTQITDKREEKQDKEVKSITLEQVRAKLSSLSQSGKQAEVKELIKKFGGNKLTDIPKEKYEELMKAAEEI